MDKRTAVVTGASSGIGRASAIALAKEGFHVICAARRVDRLQELCRDIDGTAVHLDVTSDDDVAHLVDVVGARCDVLVNNAGGALGQDPLASSDLSLWGTMYATNVVGAARVTKALLPSVEAAEGSIVFVTSTAAETAYEGGAGYCAAKSAERAMVGSLRLELCGLPVRVIEVAPGMVHTEEFSLVRYGGDQARADAVYAGVPNPLTADDVAETIRWSVSLPSHVNVDKIVVRPRSQAANHKIFRQS
ncbi:gamma-glutamyltransferase [Platysternon megacephalum]|uniref:Dehydrogenase/reductase SDR family member 11 n=1 Tax=Platysternon megacephalum TaxID=55544 RepID=A0A4D9DB43_9SAUR|nr:gamma-glutamyltransferase [Platysternon megacephalum]